MQRSEKHWGLWSTDQVDGFLQQNGFLPEEVKGIKSRTKEEWGKLMAANKFNTQLAFNSNQSLSTQRSLGKNVEMVIHNAQFLPSIKTEIKYQGRVTTTLLLIEILRQLNRLSVGKNAFNSDAETKQIAENLLNDVDLRSYKLIELDLVVKNILTGKAGKIYDRMDQAVLYDAISEYDRERAVYIEMKRMEGNKPNLDDMKPDKEGLKKLADAMGKLASLSADKQAEKRKVNVEIGKKKVKEDQETLGWIMDQMERCKETNQH